MFRLSRVLTDNILTIIILSNHSKLNYMIFEAGLRDLLTLILTMTAFTGMLKFQPLAEAVMVIVTGHSPLARVNM